MFDLFFSVYFSKRVNDKSQQPVEKKKTLQRARQVSQHGRHICRVATLTTHSNVAMTTRPELRIWL